MTRCPWRPDTAAVCVDFYMEDGTSCPMDARQILKGVMAEYAELGLEPRASIEWEFYLYEVDDDLMRAKRFTELKTFGRGWDFYSLSKYPSFENFSKEFMARCLDSGIAIEAFHTEYGHGMFEFTCAHENPLKAADDALRAKGYLRSLADEYGLVPTFMPALHMHSADSHNGAHHNISLWRDGVNACWDPETRDMSKLAGHFAAGMMETMPDLHLAFRPWVNSHRRMDRLSWAPEDTLVGARQPRRRTAGRLRLDAGEDGAPRAPRARAGREPVPVAGGDVRRRPEGHQGGATPPPYAVGDPIENGNYPRLPKTLEASVEAMRGRPIARSILGDQLVDHLVNVHAEEAAEFAAWAEANGVDPALDAPVRSGSTSSTSHGPDGRGSRPARVRATVRLRAVPDRHPARRRGRARLHAELILTSGAPLPWRSTSAASARRSSARRSSRARGEREEAEAKLAAGEIRVAPCHDHGCVGSVAGVYTASMPVFVVENRPFGNVGFCNFYEGNEPRRLNYGCYDDAVHDQLHYVHEQVAPVVGDAVRRSGGIALKPIMRRALQTWATSCHRRNAAATMLFERRCCGRCSTSRAEDRRRVDATVEMLGVERLLLPAPVDGGVEGGRRRRARRRRGDAS